MRQPVSAASWPNGCMRSIGPIPISAARVETVGRLFDLIFEHFMERVSLLENLRQQNAQRELDATAP